MDEATSNIDMEADAKIQNMLKTVFGDCTVISIAHRIDTILWYDKVLVMEQGQVLEYDTPDKLKNDTSSEFHALLKEFN